MHCSFVRCAALAEAQTQRCQPLHQRQGLTSLLCSQALARLEELVRKIKDLIDHRVEANLSSISKMRLVDLADDRSFAYDEFVTTQAKFVRKQAETLAIK